MKDYTKECWCCERQSMETRGSFWQCRDCGATWNEVAKPGIAPLDEHASIIHVGDGTIKIRTGKPSGRLLASVRKARESKVR
uniref:Uncharacterized protein n=1 Tax=viral metagenome TaxID=1070528 RepID=A0A6M3Y1Q5_9ZZZZ